MSREGAGSKGKEEPTRPAGTSMWVGAVYFLGAIGAVMLGFLLLMRLAAALFWENAPSYDASVPVIVLWGALVVVAIGLWVSRRRG